MTVDLKTFNNFFLSYQKRFIDFAYTYVQDISVAEDFVIEAMMEYWEHKEQLPPDTNIPAYVLTIVKNKCIDYLRQERLKEETMTKMSDLHNWELKSRIDSLNDFIPEDVFTKEIQEIVEKTMESLPARTKQIFMMSRYEYKSHKEIASILNISTKGVEYHISQATHILRIALKDYLTISVLLYYFS